MTTMNVSLPEEMKAFVEARVAEEGYASAFQKYLVFYRPIADGIEVVRVLHGARDVPGLLADDLGIAGEAGEDEAPDRE